MKLCTNVHGRKWLEHSDNTRIFIHQDHVFFVVLSEWLQLHPPASMLSEGSITVRKQRISFIGGVPDECLISTAEADWTTLYAVFQEMIDKDLPEVTAFSLKDNEKDLVMIYD